MCIQHRQRPKRKTMQRRWALRSLRPWAWVSSKTTKAFVSIAPDRAPYKSRNEDLQHRWTWKSNLEDETQIEYMNLTSCVCAKATVANSLGGETECCHCIHRAKAVVSQPSLPSDRCGKSPAVRTASHQDLRPFFFFFSSNVLCFNALTQLQHALSKPSKWWFLSYVVFFPGCSTRSDWLIDWCDQKWGIMEGKIKSTSFRILSHTNETLGEFFSNHVTEGEKNVCIFRSLVIQREVSSGRLIRLVLFRSRCLPLDERRLASGFSLYLLRLDLPSNIWSRVRLVLRLERLPTDLSPPSCHTIRAFRCAFQPMVFEWSVVGSLFWSLFDISIN